MARQAKHGNDELLFFVEFASQLETRSMNFASYGPFKVALFFELNSQHDETFREAPSQF